MNSAEPQAVCGLDRLPDGRIRLHLADIALALDPSPGEWIAARPAHGADQPWSARALPYPAAAAGGGRAGRRPSAGRHGAVRLMLPLAEGRGRRYGRQGRR
ncbi:hypothetical protein ONA91_35650 [Micromonospora sp. DR5-3]|uniref:hypothetical protein n=1 Tax=unclassified Micromonospora TaxID=2617518 RepID=UPI0011D8607A|nr:MULTISPECIES: hypothetical protein [unclassified Micromonospora]MCW3819785.1 hypothetical protein [Micromonospora sp. DR5-3]TYC11452.1 hypothetical protein FXF52_40395 [Micromonospora sp. MP36]